jgi:phosphoribosylanthranilate isomerase
VLVQIYGVTTPDDAAMVNASGCDHVGVVLDEGVDTWDSVDETTLRSLVAELTDVRVVALSLSSDLDRIRRTVDIVRPDVVHLARAVDRLAPEDVVGLRAAIAPVELMTTVPVLDERCVDVARAYAPVSDYLLLDSRDPASGVVGATGLTHDWSLSRRVVDAVAAPVILAGGLGPHNIVEAIDAVAPAGVDSETHTSRSDDRRRKDPDLVVRFVAAVRGLEPSVGR